MEELYKYLNLITPISDSTWDLIKNIFVKKELNKLDLFCKVDQIATKIAFLQSGVVRSYFTNKAGREFNKNFLYPFLLILYFILIVPLENEM